MLGRGLRGQPRHPDFNGAGSYATPDAFVDGLAPALFAGAAVMALAGFLALLVPGARGSRLAPVGRDLRWLEPAGAQA